MVLVLNSKKLEGTFKKVVSTNREYFEKFSEIGADISNTEGKMYIQNKYPDIYEKFVSDVELDKTVVN